MVDVAGTAIGIMSLGLYVCQGLTSYYQVYKGQDEKIDDSLRHIEVFSNLLESVESCLANAEQEQLVTVAHANRSISACGSSIIRLENLLNRCRTAAIPAVCRVRLPLLAHRTMFPFRRGTILELENIVKGGQTNLILALQALQLEMGLRMPARISAVQDNAGSTLSEVSSIKNETMRLANSAENATRVIEQTLPSIYQNSMLTTSSLTKLGQSVLDLDEKFNTLSRVITLDPSDLEQKLDHLQIILEDNMQKMFELCLDRQLDPTLDRSRMSDKKTLQGHDPQIGSCQIFELRRPWDTAQPIEHARSDLPLQTIREHSRTLGRPKVAYPTFHLCSCDVVSNFYRRSYSTNTMNIYHSSLKFKAHHKQCPSKKSSARRIAIGLNYSCCGRLLSRIISVSMTITQSVGGTVLSPSLAFQPIVSDTSAAFALFSSSIGRDPMTLTQELWCLFKGRKASPFDINQYGETLLHVACKNIYLTSNTNARYKIGCWESLFRSLQGWGVDVNKVDRWGRSALDKIFEQIFLFAVEYQHDLNIVGLDLLCSGFEFSDTWWLEQPSISNSYWEHYQREIGINSVSYRSIEEIVNGLQIGRLSRAILQRSQTEVGHILCTFPDAIHERTTLGHSPMHLAATWPAGLKLLLNSPACILMDEPDAAGFLPISFSTRAQCVESVQMLLDAGCVLFKGVEAGFGVLPYQVGNVLGDAFQHSSIPVIECLIQGLADRRRRLADIAIRELPCEVRNKLDLSPEKVLDAHARLVIELLEERSISFHQSLFIPTWWRTVYHILFDAVGFDVDNRTSMSSVGWAEKIYKAGFVDLEGYDDAMENLLMIHFDTAHRWGSTWNLAGIILWLLAKGARLENTISRYFQHSDWLLCAPAALYVGRLITRQKEESQSHASDQFFNADTSKSDVELSHLVAQVTDQRVEDECTCACSLDGCNIVTSMLKEVARRHPEEATQALIDHIAWVVENSNEGSCGWSYFSAISIRFLTFQRLRLTHTCCVWRELWDKGFSPVVEGFVCFPSDDQIEIREEESEDLEELEARMLEFQRLCTSLKLPLVDFLRGYWTERMNDIMSTGEPVNREEALQYRELGVVWKPRSELL